MDLIIVNKLRKMIINTENIYINYIFEDINLNIKYIYSKLLIVLL